MPIPRKLNPDLKFLLIYLLCFYFLAGLGFLALRRHYQTHFSKAELERMITQTSPLRDLTSDICKYAISGNPVAAEEAYVKINLYCPSGSKSLSTFSLKTVSNRSYQNIITEMARIAGFDPDLLLSPDSSFTCDINMHPVTDITINIADKEVITCVPKL